MSMKRCGWQNRRSRRFARRCHNERHRRNARDGFPKRIFAMTQLMASLSLDLDNKWSYLKTHGDRGWESFPSYLDGVVPRFIELLQDLKLRITVFVVGQDAAIRSNHDALRSLVTAGHGIGNHSFHHEPWLHLYSPAQ